MRRVLLIVLLVWPGVVRADNLVDPVAGRLVTYLRALTPGAASAGEILDVMDADAAWPQAGVLARRYADALANERDDRVADGLCQRRAPGTAPALLRCAGASAHGEAMARRAWLVGITEASGEAWFMKRWGAAVGPEVQAARFERLAWSESPAPGGVLARQAVRLEPAMRPVAEARLALKRDDAAGPGMFAALPAVGQSDPGGRAGTGALVSAGEPGCRGGAGLVGARECGGVGGAGGEAGGVLGRAECAGAAVAAGAAGMVWRMRWRHWPELGRGCRTAMRRFWRGGSRCGGWIGRWMR